MSGLRVGSVAQIGTTIDYDGVDRDPSGLSIVVTSPSDVDTTYVYGTDPEVVQRTKANGDPWPGHYVARIPCTEAGKWTYVWTALAGQTPGTDAGDYDVEAV